jgi:hypothetical protein
MNKFQRSWQLFKSSLAVMRKDKQLLLFPILTTACTLLIGLLFLFPIAFQPTGHSYVSGAHWKAVGTTLYDTDGAGYANHDGNNGQMAIRNVKPLALVYFGVTYFASMFVATFFNVAFYQQILNALNGEAVSIGTGLRFAATKWKPILMWTPFAGLVGYIIKALEQRFGLVGRLVMRLVGTAWSIACVFVIPVLITSEKSTNPLSVLKESAMTLKNTWGESLIGYAGVSFGSAIILLLSLAWLGAGIAISVSLQLYWVLALVIVGWLAAVVLWAYVMSVASQIFRCALFLYAANGTLPAPYTNEMVTLAFKIKKS